MKRCKQCDCNLPGDYDLDYCPTCLDDTEGLIPDSVRPFEEENNGRFGKVKRGKRGNI